MAVRAAIISICNEEGFHWLYQITCPFILYDQQNNDNATSRTSK